MANTYDTETGTKPGLGERASSAASQAQEKASEMAGQVRDKAQELGQTAAAKIDEQRAGTAGALENAASKMRETADTGAQKFSSAVHTAAEGMESTAAYLREHDTRQMIGDVENVVRRYPGRSMLIAAGLGFLMGRAFRHD